MNSPDGEIGGLIDGSHMSCESLVSFHVAPPSPDRARKLSMKKLSGSYRRSKKNTLSCPFFVARAYGWNWSALPVSWLTFVGALQVAPPSSDRVSLMSACMPSTSPGRVAGL